MNHSISLSRGLIFLIAVTSGFTVANVYMFMFTSFPMHDKAGSIMETEVSLYWYKKY